MPTEVWGARPITNKRSLDAPSVIENTEGHHFLKNASVAILL